MAQESRALRPLAAVLAAAVLLTGCPAPSRRPELAPPPPPPPPQNPQAAPQPPPPTAPAPRPAPPPRENRLSPATRSLVMQARALLSRGELDGASSTLDRALRIEPNNPLVWVELGRLRLAEGDAHQAEGCGRKALALASGDRGAQAQAGRLLADALRIQRRNQEAVEIERQPFMR
ncbi:MAG: tetratricopeptide repeat protein [Pseudomonadota bacterium]|nr:tetratricopeptide repeat protein [Pseudomonadota bacterium]